MARVERLEVRRLLAATQVTDHSLPSALFDAGGGALYFSASDGVHGLELWEE